jgi:pimeloyl-ACP methyl ester carboxylesterase
MAESDTHHVVKQAAAVTMADRPSDRPAEVPADLPGVVIFIHGVNDPGVVYGTVEKGLCDGLNERLCRNDLKPGAYGGQYTDAATEARPNNADKRILDDPETYLYRRSDDDNTKSFFIPFYWGYRAANNEIAKVKDPGDVKSRTTDANGNNLLTRGQYQDKKGNRLDKNFAKAGGFFANATNNIPDMYDTHFKAPWKGRQATKSGLSGNYTYIADAPERRYFVLAAERLADLVSTIRAIQASGAAKAQGYDPKNDTITIMGHSQGTIITLLAQALLAQRGERCADCLIMVDSPYSVYTTEESAQAGRAKLKTFVDIVNEVTTQPYDVPKLAELLIHHDRHGGRTGANWTTTKAKRKDKRGNWVTFDERDNRGKVYLYFCPEDTVVALTNIRGIGTFGMPDDVPSDSYYRDPNRTRVQHSTEQLDAMKTLQGKRFYQRMWTRMERDHNGDGNFKKVLVGTAPARIAVRDNLERLMPGPEVGNSLFASTAVQAQNYGTQVSHTRNEIRFINGEALNPPYEPDLYGGEVVKGGPKPGHADVAVQLAPDAVEANIALGNQYASFEWIDVDHTLLFPPDIQPYKDKFNAGKAIDEQSQNWKVEPRTWLPGYTIKREQTPKEARQSMKSDREANNYHSGILHSSENHRWVTAMDVAIGQAVSIDDPHWRDLLIRMADWKLDTAAAALLTGHPNYLRLNQATRDLIDASARYYQEGKFPPERIVRLAEKDWPPLVTSETVAQQENPPVPPPPPVVDWSRIPG